MGQDETELTWNNLGNELAEHGADAADLARFDAVASLRKFLSMSGRGGALAALAVLGAAPRASREGLIGRGLIPVASAQEADAASRIPGKPGMIVHTARPITGEFPPHLLDDDVTPTERHFVRNGGIVPDRTDDLDPREWTLTIDGEVHQSLTLSLDELKRMPAVSMPLLIECAGNGRALFDPPVRGNPWRRGAIACSRWTGVRLRDVLDRAGLKDSARYTAHYGVDAPLGQAQPFSRGIPIDKAMEEHTLVAYEMNGEDLTVLNGYPLRLVVPGWAGSCSQKWLSRIWVRDREHDSQKMVGYSYRVPEFPVRPGTRPPKEQMKIVTAWNVKSLITRPAADAVLKTGQKHRVAGHAWAGENKVTRVAVSIDYGVRWQDANLIQPPNKFAWYRFEADVSFPRHGYYEIWARAFDDLGNAQPFRQPWNPRGYLGNVIHRLPVGVGV